MGTEHLFINRRWDPDVVLNFEVRTHWDDGRLTSERVRAVSSSPLAVYELDESPEQFELTSHGVVVREGDVLTWLESGKTLTLPGLGSLAALRISDLLYLRAEGEETRVGIARDGELIREVPIAIGPRVSLRSWWWVLNPALFPAVVLGVIPGGA